MAYAGNSSLYNLRQNKVIGSWPCIFMQVRRSLVAISCLTVGHQFVSHKYVLSCRQYAFSLVCALHFDLSKRSQVVLTLYPGHCMVIMVVTSLVPFRKAKSGYPIPINVCCPHTVPFPNVPSPHLMQTLSRPSPPRALPKGHRSPPHTLP